MPTFYTQSQINSIGAKIGEKIKALRLSLGTASTKNTGVATGQIPLAEDTFKAAYNRIGATLQAGNCDEFARGTIFNVYASTVLNSPPTTFGDLYYIVHTYAAHNTYENSLIQIAYGFSKPVTVMRSANQGRWSTWQLLSTNPITYNTTTAAGANVVVTAVGELQRSTSSERYKNIIAPLILDENLYKKAMDLNPIIYRSTASADDPLHHYYSFSAEALGALDPAFTFWRNTEQVTETYFDEEGLEQVVIKEVELETPIAEGLNINAILAFNHAISIKQSLLIEDLTERLTTLENAQTTTK